MKSILLNCPLCLSREIGLKKTYLLSEIQKKWIDNLHIDISPEIRGNEFGLYLCKNCGLQFFLPMTNVGSDYLYSQLEKNDWYYMPKKWEHDKAIYDLRKCSKILEVGCGFGAFVERLQKEIQSNVEGIELNRSAVQKAQERNLPVNRVDLIELAKEREGYYEAVCSFQVLEHVADPGEFLGACCRLLKPGGLLILGLPNSESFLKYQFNILDMPPHHMTHWSPRVLKRLPQHLPIKLLHIKYEPLQTYHIEGYVDAYLSFFSIHGIFLRLNNSRVKNLCVKLIKNFKLNKLLIGQSFYVCYKRL